MRIIVTKNGIEIVEELDEMDKSNSLTSKLNKNIFPSKNGRKIQKI